MKRILNQILIVFLIFLSWIPLNLLYLISDCFYFLIYYVVKYRRKVVLRNLTNSFPKFDVHQIKKLEKSYYRFLSDLIIESVKGFSISKKQLLKRIQYTNVEVYDQYFYDKRSAIVVMGHNGNWEWISRSAPLFLKNNVVVAYKPLTNKSFDYLMIKTRTAFGLKAISMSQVARFIKEEKEPFFLILVSDQSPSDTNGAVWLDFLNQKTPVLNGVGKLAEKYNLPVLFNEVKKTKRGYYACTAHVLVEQEEKLKAEDITTRHTQFLEQKINEQIEIWIWSHRRWKHKPK
ncbi:MAG TPA: lysophospholipid acyltransferase family protein [Bacteroidia bacterium]